MGKLEALEKRLNRVLKPHGQDVDSIGYSDIILTGEALTLYNQYISILNNVR